MTRDRIDVTTLEPPLYEWPGVTAIKAFALLAAIYVSACVWHSTISLIQWAAS